MKRLLACLLFLAIPMLVHAADWPTIGGQGSSTFLADTATSGSQSITCGSTVASFTTPTYTIGGLSLFIEPTSANAAFMFNIRLATGGSIYVPNIPLYGGATVGTCGQIRRIPITLPSNTSFEIDCTSTAALSTAEVWLATNGQDFISSQTLTRATSYGTITANEGPSIDCGAAANTKGSWVQITASTTNPIRLMSMYLVHGRASQHDSFLFDIGVGAGGSETVVRSNIHVNSDDGCITPNDTGPFAIDIPSGTRIAVRCQSDQTVSDLTGIIIGFD